jgi:hypothetical protein
MTEAQAGDMLLLMEDQLQALHVISEASTWVVIVASLGIGLALWRLSVLARNQSNWF